MVFPLSSLFRDGFLPSSRFQRNTTTSCDADCLQPTAVLREVADVIAHYAPLADQSPLVYAYTFWTEVKPRNGRLAPCTEHHRRAFWGLGVRDRQSRRPLLPPEWYLLCVVNPLCMRGVRSAEKRCSD